MCHSLGPPEAFSKSAYVGKCKQCSHMFTPTFTTYTHKVQRAHNTHTHTHKTYSLHWFMSIECEREREAFDIRISVFSLWGHLLSTIYTPVCRHNPHSRESRRMWGGNEIVTSLFCLRCRCIHVCVWTVCACNLCVCVICVCVLSVCV